MLGKYLLDHFAIVSSVGGYARRRNTADTKRLSVHGTGRAVDGVIPTDPGAPADPGTPSASDGTPDEGDDGAGELDSLGDDPNGVAPAIAPALPHSVTTDAKRCRRPAHEARCVAGAR